MRPTAGIFLLALGLLAACSGPPAGQAPDAAPAESAAADAAADAIADASADIAADAAGDIATGAAAGAQPAAATDAERSATERALAQLSAAYEDLAERFGDEPGRAIDWAESDIENLGDWEYRIVVLADAAADDLEAELNALGQERWEVYWVETTRQGLRIFLKRPAVSYLSRVPLTTLLRLLGGGAQ